MKTLAILFTLFYFLNALAVAPYGIKGQNQNVTYPNVYQYPNYSVTGLGGINALIETGNKNILQNPSFEAPFFGSAPPSWTSLGMTFNTSALPLSGQKAVRVSVSSSAMAFAQDSGVSQAAFAGGIQCLAMVYVKTTVSGIFVSSRQNSVTSTTNRVAVNNDGKYGLYKVPFICGSGSNGISIHSNGVTVTGDVDVDDSFVGAVDLKQDVPLSSAQSSFTVQAVSFGVATITGATTSTDGSGIYSYVSGTGIYTALKKAIIQVDTSFRNSSSLAVQPLIQKNGTDISVTQSGPVLNSWISTSASFSVVPGDTFLVRNGANTTDNQRVLVSAIESVNTSVYTASNADTDWASCGLTGAAFTGFGTVTSIETQCKRQGSDLLMRGRFQNGTPTAVEARIALPVWNGAQLSSATTFSIPSIQIAGRYGSSASVPSSPNGSGNTLIEPSVAYLTFSGESTAGLSITKQTGTAITTLGNQISINARIPILGWENSNIIIGSFNGLQSCTNTLACTDTFSAFIGSAGAVSTENVDWINGNASVSDTSLYGISFNSGIFTTAPNCVLTPISTNAAATLTTLVSSISSTAINARTMVNVAKTAFDFSIICQKQGADYIGKTAMAVASDQNTRSIGVTKSVIQSCKINNNGTATIDNSSTLCGWLSSVSRTSIGNVTINVNSGIFASPPICTLTSQSFTNVIPQRVVSTSASSILSVFIVPNTSALADSDFVISCHGVSP